MYKNTDENMMYKLPVRSLNRSDGTVKIYGGTKDGRLLTVVMRKTDTGDYTTTEIKVAGKITYCER